MTPHVHVSTTYINKEKEMQIAHVYFSFSEKKIPQNVESKYRNFIEKKIKKNDFTGKDSEMLFTEHLEDTHLQHIVLLGMGKSESMSVSLLRNRCGELMRSLCDLKIDVVVVHAEDIGKVLENVQVMVEGLILGSYTFNEFKGNESKKKLHHINEICILVKEEKKEYLQEVAIGEKIARAVSLTRDLVNTPASHVDPSTLVHQAQEIARNSKGSVTVDILNEEECHAVGMGAFLGVAQGSEKKPSFIVLKYKGKGKKSIALIGKSITFDSGGLSLKPSEAMMDMKIDMAGGATVLGVFQFLADQQPDTSFKDIYGILPACENMPSGSALKPGDIVTAMNGKTIEVLNTDAEGRLTLADALVYAEKQLRVEYCVDLATLTGACMVALGTDLAGVFTNSEEVEKEYAEYAQKAGDEYWRLPLYSGYAKQMKSDIADVKNIGGGRYGGAITAGLFLNEFVDKMKWMHIDIAGPAYRAKGKGIFPQGASGWGVISIINFLEKFHSL